MATLRELNISLLDWEARYILESLSRELDRLKAVSEISDDEDDGRRCGERLPGTGWAKGAI